MREITVHFVHPTNERTIAVGIDETMTGREAINELIASKFIPPSAEGYNLAIKGGKLLDNSKSLLENGVEENFTLKVIPATDAGIDII